MINGTTNYANVSFLTLLRRCVSRIIYISASNETVSPCMFYTDYLFSFTLLCIVHCCISDRFGDKWVSCVGTLKINVSIFIPVVGSPTKIRQSWPSTYRSMQYFEY